MNPSMLEVVGTGLFAVAVAHTFLTKYFEHLAHLQPNHAGIWHLLGEVEVVFGFWAFVLLIFMAVTGGASAPTTYLEGLNYTEPAFVFIIMVVAASRPILELCKIGARALARYIPLHDSVAFYFVCLAVLPLLGSFITEPAAMTLAALMLRDNFYAKGISHRLKYVTLGALFVNVSIGGTLTHFAAPPVLMVAAKWNWDMWYMLGHFGWKAALAVFVNAGIATFLFARELKALKVDARSKDRTVPWALITAHVAFLVGIVYFAHHPIVFVGLFLLFLGVAEGYRHYHDRLMLREGLMVGFFLAGLVTLGALQQWWLQDILAGMDTTALYFGATALTAITDNAALTYLGSLVEGTDEAFKYSLVAGAVTGGGLTVIANAPNPAGFAILRGNFDDEAINPLGLLVTALPPTFVAILAFQLL
ncbi:putative Na+/H+ antiporter [Aromatoleum anaerobium]|uniref:Na+/H+ antiporter n=1 Tax=Aromatoleum anaerobium TaxID=182180 RepID=A0ABX1PMC7_9RHOO|nr:putative Na+/H+ antiporter [Aromatoleum anaerobium]MCK0507010.1 putative Na+/H+ antiporter [Aromatoleum anaerobium]